MKTFAGSVLVVVGVLLMAASYVAWRVAHMCDNCEPRFNSFMGLLLAGGAVVFVCGAVVFAKGWKNAGQD
jgi:uncharacterized membrane protein YidH (DUF202 family)